MVGCMCACDALIEIVWRGCEIRLFLFTPEITLDETSILKTLVDLVVTKEGGGVILHQLSITTQSIGMNSALMKSHQLSNLILF